MAGQPKLRLYMLSSFLITNVILWMPSLASAENGVNCDRALVELIDMENINRSYSNAWLQIVNRDNYEEAKRKAKGQAYADTFSGSYEEFKKKRELYFEQNGGSTNISDARETFKTYLSPEQLTAWSQCNRGLLKPSVMYKHVQPREVTIVLEWKPDDAVGSLNKLQIDVTGGEKAQPKHVLEKLKGSDSFVLVREPGNALRGIVRGVYGVNDTNTSAEFFVPPYSEPEKLVVNKRLQEPKKTVMKIEKSNDVLYVKALHDRKRKAILFKDCMGPISKNMTLVVLEEATRDVGLKRHHCVTSKNVCDGPGEGCVETYIRRGCYVNTEWRDWYKIMSEQSGLPYSESVLCESPN